MKRTGMEKLEVSTAKTLIGGIDIAKKVHWARYVDYRGISIGKPLRGRTPSSLCRNLQSEGRS